MYSFRCSSENVLAGDSAVPDSSDFSIARPSIVLGVPDHECMVECAPVDIYSVYTYVCMYFKDMSVRNDVPPV